MIAKLRHRLLGNASPLSTLCGGGLLIMASDRLAHALTILGALLWVYCLSTLAVYAGSKVFPRRGGSVLLAFLTSFVAGIFALLLWIMSPLCAMEMFFAISLVPIVCISSGILQKTESQSLKERIFNSLWEALVLGIVIVIFAIIREPLGYLSLSLPGGPQGIVLLFSLEKEFFLPVHLIAGSCGALLLLGYFLGLYRRYREEK